MTTAKHHFAKNLYGGGRLYCYQLGGLFQVDVMGADQENHEDPIYHATYSTFKEAQQDADRWKPWPV